MRLTSEPSNTTFRKLETTDYEAHQHFSLNSFAWKKLKLMSLPPELFNFWHTFLTQRMIQYLKNIWTQVSVEQLATMVSWHMIQHMTAWLSSSVLNSPWDLICFVDAISNLLAPRFVCKKKTEQKRNLLRHFSNITGKSQPSVNNIMTGDENSLASSSTTQKWNAKVSNRRVCRIIKWPFLGAYTKLWKATISFIMSVCPSVFSHGITPFPKDGFSWKLISEYFSKTCQENLSFLKIKKE